VPTEALREQARHWLSANADETVLRWLFRAVLAATVVVVALDYNDLTRQMAERANAPALGGPESVPLPTIKREHGARRGMPSHALKAKLNGKMTFDLMDGGRLMAVGTIMPGTAKAFAAEVKKRDSYIKSIVLQSPGGSVADALSMGRMIRAHKFATEVDKGQYCASSCPLVFAGGVKRRAGAEAAIGVHQVFAPPQPGLATAADGFDNAQRITASAEGYLRDMGVDLGVWLKAMQTPKDELYYFSPAELVDLKLATEAAGVKPASKRKARL